MQRLYFEYAASQSVKQRAHVGVVGSSDLGRELCLIKVNPSL
jgi:hypothetical protein